VEIKTLKCQNCGAPLEVGESQERITCPYCGVVNVVLGDAPVAETPGAVQAQKARSVAIFVVVAVALLIMTMVFVFIVIALAH
jgi:phage FluMu protein Com